MALIKKKKSPKAKETNIPNPVYHISQNKEPRQKSYKLWRVRLEQSEKTIKFFNTQGEAIEYAENLAKNNNGSIVIHMLDGKIRKQKY